MANEKRLIPCGEKCTLDELLPGTIFAFGDDCIAVKSEYRCNNGLIEAFIIDSGEQFWGGVHTAEEQNALMVQPLEIVDVDAVEVVHGQWLNTQIEAHDPFGYYMGEVDVFICSVCGVQFDVSECRNYCPNCGAKMDGERREGE